MDARLRGGSACLWPKRSVRCVTRGRVCVRAFTSVRSHLHGTLKHTIYLKAAANEELVRNLLLHSFFVFAYVSFLSLPSCSSLLYFLLLLPVTYFIVPLLHIYAIHSRTPFITTIHIYLPTSNYNNVQMICVVIT